MTTPRMIPLSPEAQEFDIDLNNVTYHLIFHWCDPMQVWVLDIEDHLGTPIVMGIPLVTGADLLAQYGYLNFGGQLIVQSSFDCNCPPNYTELGTTGNLFFVS